MFTCNINIIGDISKQAQNIILQIKESLLSAEPLLKESIGDGTDDNTHLVNIIYPEIEKKYKAIIPKYSSWLARKNKLLNKTIIVFVQGYKVLCFTKRKRLILFVCKQAWDFYYKKLTNDNQSTLTEKRRENEQKSTFVFMVDSIALKIHPIILEAILAALLSFALSLPAILGSKGVSADATNSSEPTLMQPSQLPLTPSPLSTLPLTPTPPTPTPAPTPTPTPNSTILQSEYDIKCSYVVKLNYTYEKYYESNDIFLGMQPDGDEEKLKNINDLYIFTRKVAYYDSFQKNALRECGKSWYQILLYENKKDPYSGDLFWIDGDYIYKPALQWLVCESKSSCEITIASNTIRKSTISSGYTKNSTGALLPLDFTPKSVYTDLFISGRKYRFDPRYQDATQKYIFFFKGGVGEDYEKLKQDMMIENEDADSLIFYGGIINGEFKGYIYSVRGTIDAVVDQRILPENDKEKFKIIGEISFSVVDPQK